MRPYAARFRTRSLAAPARLALMLLASFLLASAAFAAPSTDAPAPAWRSWSGPNGDLTVRDDVLPAGDSLAMAVDWRRPLGSAYSAIVGAGDRILTAYADGEHDVLAALDAAAGTTLWQQTIGPVYKGHSGSDDGLVSSPTASADGAVYAVGAHGDLLAAQLDDGTVLWRRHLVDDFGGRAPHYGFASAPLVVGDLLIVTPGGDEGRAIVALDRRTGETRWTTGDDRLDYQAATVVDVGGTRQIVASTNSRLLGLAPADGAVLWERPHDADAGASSTQLIPYADGVLANEWTRFVRYRIGADGPEVAWTSRALGNSYVTPVPYGDHIFGYKGRFLTAVDAATGKVAWKSRPPGGGTLVAVDGHLVILAGSGDVVLVEATGAGYREAGRVAALERGYYTAPTYASGRVYVRNLKEISAISVRPGEASADAANAAADATVPDDALRGAFGDAVRHAMTLEPAARTAHLTKMLDAHDAMPILEGENLAHFVYRGDVPDLALVGSFLSLGEEQVMQRVPGTDVWFHSREVPAAARFSYSFRVFEEARVDPANPHTVGAAQPTSDLRTQGFELPAHRAPRADGAPSGRLEEMAWTSEIFDARERTVQVWLPPGYGDDASSARHPLLIVNHGNFAVDADLPRSLDHLVNDDAIVPPVVAFVPRANWPEYNGGETADYVRAMATELVPALNARYALRDKPTARMLYGPGSAGFASLWAAVHHPDVFGGAAAQSYYHGELGEALMKRIADGPSADQPTPRIVLAWSTNDYGAAVGGEGAEADSRALAEALEAAGYPLETVVTPHGPDWTGWIVPFDRIAGGLLAAPQGD
ncbi:MAG: PQQ-binding-like beta-propeller repeat protein [Acidobacteriota bacterium]